MNNSLTQTEQHARIRAYLQPGCDLDFDYDVLHDILYETVDEQLDLVVRLSYNLSIMKLSSAEALCAYKKIGRLAQDCLRFNLNQENDDTLEVQILGDLS